MQKISTDRQKSGAMALSSAGQNSAEPLFSAERLKKVAFSFCFVFLLARQKKNERCIECT